MKRSTVDSHTNDDCPPSIANILSIKILSILIRSVSESFLVESECVCFQIKIGRFLTQSICVNVGHFLWNIVGRSCRISFFERVDWIYVWSASELSKSNSFIKQSRFTHWHCIVRDLVEHMVPYTWVILKRQVLP